MILWKYIKTCLVAMLLTLAPWASADTQFRLIVDASGSMLISDPDKLTAESLKLISDLAPEEKATLGVWLFGERARVLLPEALINKQTKQNLSQAVRNYTPGDLKTDLESVIRMLLKTPDSGNLAPDFERHWIIVTDGMVDVSLDEKVNEASRSRIMNDLATQLAERGIHLHTVSMTGYTDKELLQSVSALTDATHTEVATPNELLDTFDRVFSQAAPSEEVPFEGNTFFIDEAIEEATLLIFHESGATPKIFLPNNQPLNLDGENISYVDADHYILLTVTNPKVGTWKVENVDLERSNIRVITKLSLQATKVAPVLFVNEPIYSTLGLFQDNSLIEDPEMLDLVAVTQRLNLISGGSTKQLIDNPLAIANHQFKNKIEQLTHEGNYELISEVDGKTFVRKLSQFFSVTAPINFEAEQQGEGLVAFSAKPTNLRLNLMRSNARLILTTPNGNEESVEIPLIGEGFWQKIYPVAPNSVMSAHIHLIGITQSGGRFEYTTPYWYLNRKGAGAVKLSQSEDDNAAAAATAALAVNRNLAPVVVTPQIAIVSQEELVEQDTVPESEDTITDANVDDGVNVDGEEVVASEEKAVGLSKGEWILYGSLNAAAMIVLLGGYFIVRRIRKKRKQLTVE